MRQVLLVCLICFVMFDSGCKRGGNQSAGSNSNSASVPTDGVAQAKALLDKGRDFYANDQDTQAVEAFQQAVSLDPNLPEAHFRLGLAYEAIDKQEEAEGEYKKAVEGYKKYLDENPKDAEARYNLGQAYSLLHQYTEAVREFRQATKLKEDDSAIFFDLGVALTKLAQYDEAASAFSKSLELDPENYRAEDALEEAREGVKRVRDGRKHQEALLKKQKEDELKKAGEQPPGSSDAKPTPPKG